MIWYRFCKGKRKAAQEVNFILEQKIFATLCTHHLIFFGGVSASIPKLEHGGEVASVAASRKKKRLVGLWKVASECRGSLLRSTIRLLVDGGCDAEAAVKQTGTTSVKLSKKRNSVFANANDQFHNFSWFASLEIFCFALLTFCWNQLNYWAFESSKLFRFLLICAYQYKSKEGNFLGLTNIWCKF